MKFNKAWKMLPVVALLSLATSSLMAQDKTVTTKKPAQITANPYSPAYDHPYRHGVMPTVETHAQMRQWEKAQISAGNTAVAASKTLSYGGGVNGIGVTSGQPKVYLVVWGSQWGSSGTDSNGNMTFSNDPVGAMPQLQKMFKGLGTGGELWSGVMTQYCDGPSVARGATTCPSGAPHVGYPTGGSAFAGIWYDNSASAPTSATASQIEAEAQKAAAHFGNTTAASNRYAQYVILSATGMKPDGFPNAGWCAWHNYFTSSYGDLAYTNMPYVYDAGSSCGKGFVNGANGNLDGFTMVEGHEYSETVTDQNPSGGWTNASDGQENADECSWISTGQGASANVTMGTGTFAMQSTWSNDTNRCDISHPIVGGVVTPPTALSNGVPVTGLSLATGAQKVYSFVVPAGATSVTFNTSGGTGDVDIYVQLGSTPSTTSYLQKSDGSTTTESITIATPTAGTYYILVNGYAAASGFQIVANYSTTPTNVLTSGVPVTGIALATGANKVYSIVVPAGRTSLTIKTTGGTGDADIYVKLGAAPTTSSYLQKSDGSTNTETITVSSPAAGTYYILVNAYAAVSGLSLTATY